MDELLENEVENQEDNRELREKQITSLVTAYYKKFDFLQSQNLNIFINKALDKYLDSDLTIEEINEDIMKKILDIKRTFEARFDKEKVVENHSELYARLDTLVSLLAKAGIDYQVAGALCSYLKYGEESDRVHDDIDLNMNEDDLVKFAMVCNELGYIFHDNRMDSPRVLKNGIPTGDHEVFAEIPGSDLHIGIFCFKRNEDGSVDNKSYYKDEDGNTMVWNEHISSKLAKLLFGAEIIEYNGKKMTITPPEYVYSLKSYTRKDKDLHDLGFMDGKIDMDKLNEIRTLTKTDRRVDLISVDNLFIDLIDNSNELNTMLEPENNTVIDKGLEEKPKLFIKKNNDISDESGFIYYRQIVVPYIVLVIMVVLIEIFNIIS